MPVYRNRRATLRQAEIIPPRSGRPKGDDGGATWPETAPGGGDRPDQAIVLIGFAP
jgi:hypothetical protein